MSPRTLSARSLTADDFGRIESFTRDQLDELPFGTILLDLSGRILEYNLAEARLAGLDREQVVGRDFFSEVAPCTNVQAFAGRFREAMDAAEEVRFAYEFAFRRGPVEVEIVIRPSLSRAAGWVFVTVAAKGSAARDAA
jgi:photoactive yellow protein